MNRILQYKVDFPELSSLIIIALVTLLAAVIFSFSDVRFVTLHFLNRFYPETLEEYSNENKQTRTDEVEDERRFDAPSKLQADIVTMIMWGVFGLLAYYGGSVFHTIFIKPLEEDKTEAHFVNIDRHYLKKKRLLWVLGVTASMVLIIGILYVFRNLVLSYLTLSLYLPSVSNILTLIFSIVITTMMIAFARLAVRVVIRAY